MAEQFEISIDLNRRVLSLKVWGFWSLKTAECFRDIMLRSMISLDDGSPWSVLADVRMFPIQPPKVQDVIRELMRLAVKYGMRRSANIVGGRLTRIQIERLSGAAWPERGRFSYFTSQAEAENWLGEPEDGSFERSHQKLFQTL